MPRPKQFVTHMNIDPHVLACVFMFICTGERIAIHMRASNMEFLMVSDTSMVHPNHEEIPIFT